MTREEAQAQADALNHNASERSQQHWTIRNAGGENWQVVTVTVPGMQLRAGPLHTTTEQRPQPEELPDPRSTITRLIPPYGG